MVLDISIDISDAVEIALEKAAALFGRDRLTSLKKDRLDALIRLGSQEASFIQCVGMSRPIPLSALYQTSRLCAQQFEEGSATLTTSDVADLGEGCIIWGAPGAGKSIFLKSLYLHLLKQPDAVPLLITLRNEGAVEDLAFAVDDLVTGARLKPRNKHLVLLIDGYDEVPTAVRKQVSSQLRKFSSLLSGYFVLSCRLHYEVVDLNARHLWMLPFTPEDAASYIDLLARSFRIKINARKLLEELSQNGFDDFTSSPLMLTLVCILKSGAMKSLPRSSIGLIRRAIDTLTFRWDESKGVARDGICNVDGEERVRCLMMIAYSFSQPVGREAVAVQATTSHLSLIQRADIDPLRLLTETAQWYGLFVPIGEAEWTFTHRTIHDFLAARYWVESGGFSKFEFGTAEWNARAGYAACLVPDATEALCQSLANSKELTVLLECLKNHASFSTAVVSRALLRRLDVHKDWDSIEYNRGKDSIWISAPFNFLEAASDQFVLDLHHIAAERDSGRGPDIAYAMSAYEIHLRPSLSDRSLERHSGLDLKIKIPGESEVWIADH